MRLDGGGRLLTFSAFRMGAYSRWTLIRGCALIRINTVDIGFTLKIIGKICRTSINLIFFINRDDN